MRCERAVGERVESFVKSDAYFDLLARATKTRARLLAATEGFSQEWLRLWNLPAGSDVRQLRAQVSRMERTLAALAKDVADRDVDDGSNQSTTPR